MSTAPKTLSTPTRKERERQQREALILSHAREMLVKVGYLGLSMDAIAAELEYSKGTIYNHFSCKEEILIALAVESMEKRVALFEKAATFPGTPRERIIAIGIAAELFVRIYPSHFQVEQLIRSFSIWEKTSEQRRQTMRLCESRCMGIAKGVVRDAIAQGHLSLPESTGPENVSFGLWSLVHGGHTIIATSESLTDLGIKEPFNAVRTATKLCLDGLGWQPVLSEEEHREVVEQLRENVFSDEIADLPLPTAGVSDLATKPR